MKLENLTFWCLAVFAFGLGIGIATPALATCLDDCRQDRIECRHDCGYNPPEYQAYCFAQCDANYASCASGC